MTKVDQIMKKVDQTMKSKSVSELCKLFGKTNNNQDRRVPTVRGWIMDELEKRNQSKFDAWMDTENVDDMDYPEKFFI